MRKGFTFISFFEFPIHLCAFLFLSFAMDIVTARFLVCYPVVIINSSKASILSRQTQILLSLFSLLCIRTKPLYLTAIHQGVRWCRGIFSISAQSNIPASFARVMLSIVRPHVLDADANRVFGLVCHVIHSAFYIRSAYAFAIRILGARHILH